MTPKRFWIVVNSFLHRNNLSLNKLAEMLREREAAVAANKGDNVGTKRI